MYSYTRNSVHLLEKDFAFSDDSDVRSFGSAPASHVVPAKICLLPQGEARGEVEENVPRHAND